MPREPEPPRDLPPGQYILVSGGAWSTVARFVLRGRRLDPDIVTSAIGIEPTSAGKRGEPRPANPERTHQTGFWHLDSDDVLSRSDDHLDDHLRWLLDHLEPRARQVKAVVAEQELEAEFWCVVWMEAPNCDFELPPETIGRVAALGATLRLDTYAPEGTEHDVIEIPEHGAHPKPSDGD